MLLSSASGEICAMVTKDYILAKNVVTAINEAIVSRRGTVIFKEW
jgi:hypothetical protein